MKREFSRHIFQKSPNIRFHEDRSSGSCVLVRRQTTGWMAGRTDRQTDMTKLILDFRNFANATGKHVHDGGSLDLLQNTTLAFPG